MSSAVSIINPKFYAWDNDTGRPLAFGKVYTYETGTNTEKPTYTSEGGTVENPNPVVLNGAGYAEIYLRGAYKVVVKDSDDQMVWTADPVTDPSGLTQEWVNERTASRESPTSFSISGDQSDIYTPGRAVRLDDGAYDYGAVGAVSYDGNKTIMDVTGADPLGTGLSRVWTGIVSSRTAPTKGQDGTRIVTFGETGSAPGEIPTNTDLRVDTLADLQAQDTGNARSVQMLGRSTAGDGAAGTFVWDSSDLSTEVGNDEVTAGEGDGGIYVAPASDKTGASGAWVRQLKSAVTPQMYGAVANSSADDSTAFQKAVSNNSEVIVPQGTYKLSASVSIKKSNFSLDLGEAIIINDNAVYVFDFGETSDLPIYNNIHVKGGFFKNLDNTQTNAGRYINFDGVEQFSIKGGYHEYVGNGAIKIGTGCWDGFIDGVRMDDIAPNTTNRSIWLVGSGSDYESQVLDLDTLEVDETKLPQYAVKRVHISNCIITKARYGIYMMNTRDCSIDNCYVDISGNGLRCVAVNNYSPGAIVTNNHFKSDNTSTGILVTQGSNNVVISGNIFTGSFESNRDIYVQFAAEAVIKNNTINTQTRYNIQINHNAKVVIDGNAIHSAAPESKDNFDTAAVQFDTLDGNNNDDGSLMTKANAVIITNNTCRMKARLVQLFQKEPSGHSTYAGWETCVVKGNVIYDLDKGSYGLTQPLRVGVIDGSNGNGWVYRDNIGLPANSSSNRINNDSESEQVSGPVDFLLAKVITDGAGGVSVKKLNGGQIYSISSGLSGNEIRLRANANDGSNQRKIVAVTPISDSIYDYKNRYESKYNYIQLIDGAGNVIDPSANSVSFDILVNASISVQSSNDL